MRNILIFIITISYIAVGYTQEVEQQIQFGDRPAQYILGGNDVLLITVNLWGHIQRPGIYSIPSAYGLIDLMSSAGGPLQTARISDIRIIRKNQQVISVDIEKYLKTGNSDLLPVLQPGDTIFVPGSVMDVFGRILGYVRDLAIIANAIYLVSRLK